MELEGESIDELLTKAYAEVGKHGAPNVGSRGPNIEMLGVTLRLSHPRARLSRSADRGLPFSALGELLWYLTGDDDVEFIAAYINRYRQEVGPTGKINGAYGPRIFSRYGLNQLDGVASLLKRKPGSRRAVVQVYAASDLATDEEVPCTTTLQFFVRGGCLHLAANLRSNDAYLGLPHDVFCFTMLQEMMARRLECELGEYIQMVGSFHIYDRDAPKVSKYLAEGHQRLAQMPRMPDGNPFEVVPLLLGLEDRVRQGGVVDDEIEALDPYWGDLLRLVQVHFVSDDDARLDAIGSRLRERTFLTYLENRRGRPAPKQTALSSGPNSMVGAVA